MGIEKWADLPIPRAVNISMEDNYDVLPKTKEKEMLTEAISAQQYLQKLVKKGSNFKRQ